MVWVKHSKLSATDFVSNNIVDKKIPEKLSIEQRDYPHIVN